MKNNDLLNGTRSAADIFVSAICGQSGFGFGLPYVLSYSPVSILNPFQKLLYCGAAASGYAIVPTRRFSDLGVVNWKNRSVIHLHWIASILKNCVNKEHAENCVLEFERLLLDRKARGHKILWTMHNVLPHEHVFTDEEVALRKRVVEHADAIHILSKNSIELASEFYPIPEHKVFHIPHPSYDGWYANIIDRISARQYLDLGSRDFVFLAFGSIQRYKGMIELIEAFKSLEKKIRSRSFRLIIAGKPVDVSYLRQIIDAIGSSASITLIQDSMEERDIQILFNASDIVVAPYTKTLNSGISLLAATFKKGLVAPHSPGISQTYIDDSNLLYTGDPGNELLDALVRSVSYKISDYTFERILTLHNPREVSKKFFDAVTTQVLRLHSLNSDHKS